MKSATKRLLTATLAAATILSVTPSCADEATVTTPATTPRTTEAGTEGPIPTPFFITPAIVNAPLGGTTYLNYFYIPAGYGWVKVHLENTGILPFTYSVAQGSPSGPQRMIGKVKPGETGTAYADRPWSTDWFYVSVTSGSGNMHGTLDVRIGTDLDKLKQDLDTEKPKGNSN